MDVAIARALIGGPRAIARLAPTAKEENAGVVVELHEPDHRTHPAGRRRGAAGGEPMSMVLALRIALAGGRESRIRFALMVLGTAIGTLLILLTLLVLPALQARIDRYAWHRTGVDTPATAPDAALWLPVTDRYDGRSIVRIQVAALGDRPPVPPGLARLPDAGEVFVSPALAGLLAAAPTDELARRFPGEIVDLIHEPGLVSPDELVAVIGRTPEELRAIPGTMRVVGIEQPREPLDLNGVVQIIVIFLVILLVGPVVVFVSMATRIDAARREQRFAALRLCGATQGQTAVVAVTETAGAATLGAGLAVLGFYLLLPVLHARVVFEGLRFPSPDLHAPTWQVIAVAGAIPLVAVATTLVTLRRVQMSPLGARREPMRRPPTVRHLIPLGVSLGLICLLSAASSAGLAGNGVTALLATAAALAHLVGLYLAGVYLSMLVGRALARVSSSAPAMIAARRIAADPYATFRAVGGVALAASIATLFATVAAAERNTAGTGSTVLDPGVVMVLTRGADDRALASLLDRPGVVVARQATGSVAVACAELAEVTSLTCPLAAGDATRSALEDLINPPYHRDPVDSGLPGPTPIVEPSPGQSGRVVALFVPTDGSTAAIERVRAEAILAAPYGLSRTSDDWAAGRLRASSSGAAAFLQFAMLFVIVVAASSLTVSVVASMVERRRPFAMLRAAGMPLRHLRQMALYETALPLAVTAVGGMAFAFATVVGVSLLASPASPGAESAFGWPNASFFACAGIGLAASVAVSLLSWPIMDAVTRQDSVRFE